MVDGVTFETRENVGNCIFSALDVLDDDRRFEQRRISAIDAPAGFRFFREQPGERLVVSTQNERPREQIDAKVGDGADDNETFSLKRRVVLLLGKKLISVERNWTPDIVV